MKLTFLGAAHEVTGSCFLLETGGKKVLIDCGMEQGRDIYENQELPINAADVDCVLLTHAHIDHSGNLPLLYSKGFRGDICSTTATAKLCDIMLRDSAHIQEFEAQWRNRKAQRAGEEPYTPVYTMDDAIGAIGLFRPFEYETPAQIFEGFTIRFVDAGHLLGSSSIEVKINENGIKKTLVFSGDIGNVYQPILRNPSYLTEADFVVMESTYGDRSHGPVPEYAPALAQIIQSTFDRGGNVVIPSFAVGRTQEMLYFIRKIKEDNLIHGYPNFPVYVDSPLAIEATKIFENCVAECFDEEAQAIVGRGINPLEFNGLVTTTTTEDSKNINFDKTPKVIISASGMCEAGRIRHHLKHNLWRPESTILFVGYQANGTLGRYLMDGATSVKLFGETIDVKAAITTLAGVSGHADNEGLMKWASSFKEKPTRVFVVHGEDTVCDIFAGRLTAELGYVATTPYNGEVWDLELDQVVQQGNHVKIERPAQTEQVEPGKRVSPVPHRVTPVYERLVAAGKRLTALISRSGGRSNKDIARFTDQINSICNKFER